MRAQAWRYLFIFLGAWLAFLPAAANAQHRLVTGAAKSAFVQPSPSPRVLRQRSVALELPSLAKAARDAAPYLEIAFFDDAVFRVFLNRTESTYGGGIAYSGQVATEPQSIVVIVDDPQAVAVRLNVPGRRFTIEGSAERGYVAREHLDRDPADHAPGVRPPEPQSLVVPGVAAKVANGPQPAFDDGSSIDVMVVYTQAARTQNGGTAATMLAAINAQITLTNTIYQNSNAVQRLRLVYAGEVIHTEASDMLIDLGRVRSPSDGFMDEVPLLRNLYQADFVSLWGDYSGGSSCGIGYLMTTEAASFESSAYNVTSSPDCTTGSYTFAHELGHNMGLRHDNYEDTTAATTVTPEGSGTPTAINYAHGYIDLVNRFRTVMSYDDQCQAQPAGGFFCARIPHFSNPAVSFNNAGFHAPAVLAATGNAANAHERQALNDTRETTANFRQALASFVGPGTITLYGNASVSESAGTVTLKVGRHVGSTGAVSVSYTTTAGTALAGSDYTTVAGTLNWAAGDIADKSIVVTILPDAILEGTETFTVTLSAATNGATIAAAGTTATVRIIDDEPDTFPTGVALPAGFTSPNVPNANTTDSRWTVDSTSGYLSTASLQSAKAYSPTGTFTTDGNSDLEYTANFTAGNVSFYYKLSSYHQGLAGFEFQIDGVAVFSNNVGGEVDWTLVTQPITAGTHTLRWRFKNKLPFPCAGAIGPAAPGGSACADRAWIDAVVFPAAPGTNLGIAQAAVPATGVAGKDIVFTYTASNAGPSPATNVQVTGTVPPGTTTIWATPGCSVVGSTVTCPIGPLAALATAQRQVVLRRATAGTLASNVSIAGSETDTVPANNANLLNVTVNAAPVAQQVQRYRLYSDVTKEHHFTTDFNEYTVLGTFVGTWVQEGTVGKVLDNPGVFGGVTAVPYYRLYDNNTRWHHWTTDANEYYTLGNVFAGWTMEGVDGYILPTQAPGTIELYRLNYPALGALHHWTIDQNEYQTLIAVFGWVGEPGGGFVIP